MNIIANAAAYADFIPEFNGNRALPEAEQIRVSIVNPSTKLINELVDKPKLKICTDPEQKVTGGEMEVSVDVPRMINKMVKSIANLTYTDVKTGKQVSVTNADELYSADTPAELQEFIDELGRELQKRLAIRVNSKN